MKIALCDNHAMVRDFTKQILLDCSPDSEVVEAATYDEALDAVATHVLDLVILEPAMPGFAPLEGLDMVQAAGSSRIAVMSGIEDRGTIRAALGRGIAGYIPKRLNMAATASALRVVLVGETFIPSLLFDGPEPVAAGSSIRLTDREREVLSLLRDGHSNKGIARRLNLSEVTIKSHLSSTFRKLGVQNRVQAARFPA